MNQRAQSTRRDFLQGKAALDALSELGSTIDPGDAESTGGGLVDSDSGDYLLRLSRRAMACTFEVYLNAGQYPQGTEAALEALDQVDALEDQLSVYRPHSEISELNRRAAFYRVEVEPRLFALLERAIEIHAQSAGAYDVTAGQLSNVWGFTRRSGQIPTSEALEAARACVGSQHLELNADERSARFLVPGLEINLGSIGKGYALDRACELLLARGVEQFLLHGGNSSVLARGARGLGSDEAWQVGVRHPLFPQRRLGQLRLADRALATSGSGTQFFMHEGKRYGHILDPRSGWPAEGVLSVTVLAPTAAEADALATAFYVMGPHEAAAYCQTHPDVSALMHCPGERAGSLQTHRFGLADGDWMPGEAL